MAASSSTRGAQGVDAAHVQALVLAALHAAGLGAREACIQPALRDPATRLVSDGNVDLQALWQLLTEQGAFPPSLAGRVMLLAVVYLDSQRQVALTIPQQVRIAMKLALPGFPDLEGQVAGLGAAIEQRLRA